MNLLQFPLSLLWGLYLPEASRLLFFFLHDDFWVLKSLNRLFGRLELYVAWIRDFSIIPFSLYLLGNHIYGWVKGGWDGTIPFEILLLGFSVYARWWRWRGLKILQEFARLNPKVHPNEFFDHLYRRLGFLPHRVPRKALKMIRPHHLDFKENKSPFLSFWILLHGIYDTFLFATLAYKAYRWNGAQYIRTAGSGLSIIWAARLAQLARMEVVVEKSPRADISAFRGKQIYAITHKSFFDFCLAPLVYFQENSDESARSFVPSIMVAKDHFRDNPFLYYILGFGKMLEAWGMVFVDRKSSRPGKAERAVGLTVKKLLSSDMSFSIYPQGTRAYGQRDRNGSRWDSGYFCVGNAARIKKDGGYFKKGVAFVALETAVSLSKLRLGNGVQVIPVAMEGTGIACPKGSLKVQTETKVVIKVGDPIVVDLASLNGFKDLSYQEAFANPQFKEKVDQLAAQIDETLQKLLEIKTRLERRFFTDIRGIVPPNQMEEVAIALKEWRRSGVIFYTILDCIYSLPQKHWRNLLVELAHALRHEKSAEALTGLRNRVANYF